MKAPKKNIIQKIIFEFLFCLGRALGISFTSDLKIPNVRRVFDNGINIIIAVIIEIKVINSFHCHIWFDDEIDEFISKTVSKYSI